MMKNNKYIIIFFILQFITFAISSFYSYIIGTALQTLLLFYELYYVVNVYNGKNKKYITIYLFAIILLLLGYTGYIYFKKDTSLLLGLLNLSITPIFINTFYEKNKFSRFKIIELFKLIAIILAVLFFFTKEFSIMYPLIVLFPFIFLDRNFSIKSELIGYICTVLMLVTKTYIFSYPIMIFLGLLTIYRLVNKNYKGFISSGILLAVSIFLVVKFEQYYLFEYNSDVFGNEMFLLKIAKLIVPAIPFVIYGFNTLKGFINNKLRFNYEMFIIMCHLLIFIFLSVYLRYDYSLLVILSASFSLIVFNSYLKTFDKKINDYKITIMSLHTGFGGIEKYVNSLCKMFDKKEVEIISTYKVPKSPAYEFENANIKYLMNYGPNKDKFKDAVHRINPFKIIKEGVISINTLINRKAYYIDAVTEVDSKYLITTRDFHNLYAGIYSDKDIIKIATEHNYHNDDESYISKVVKSVKYSDYFVLVSEELKNFYSKKVNKNVKCIYIPNVLDNIPKKKGKYGTHNLISVGRLDKVKAQDDLIDVVKIISKTYPDVHLTLVGDGEERDNLFSKVKEEDLTKNVTFTGFLTPDKIEEKTVSSSIFVTTSYSESFGLALVEAQSFSLPVVAFDSANGVKYLLKNGSGILVSKRNKEKMAEEIIKLFDDKKEYNSLSKKAFENAKLYKIDNIKPEWNKILSKVI